MPAAVLLIPDWPSFDAADQVESKVWPELVTLTQLLSRGERRCLTAGWLPATLETLQLTPLHAVPVARWFQQETEAVPVGCIAQPVHLIAGMSQVHLHAQGVLDLPAEELCELAETFNEALGEGQWQLRVQDDSLLLSGVSFDTEGAATAAGLQAEPLQFQGRALSAEGSAPQASPTLRRLNAEIQMWLAAHPLNQRRERARRLAVNALWFWGGGRTDQNWRPSPTVGPTRSWAVKHHCLKALARMTAGQIHAAIQLPQLSEFRVNSLLEVRLGAEPVQQLEQSVFAPLLQALDERLVEHADLILGGQSWQLKARRSLWSRARQMAARRRQNCWQMLSA